MVPDRSDPARLHKMFTYQMSNKYTCAFSIQLNAILKKTILMVDVGRTSLSDCPKERKFTGMNVYNIKTFRKVEQHLLVELLVLF